jgi:hypothetical protein
MYVYEYNWLSIHFSSHFFFIGPFLLLLLDCVVLFVPNNISISFSCTLLVYVCWYPLRCACRQTHTHAYTHQHRYRLEISSISPNVPRNTVVYSPMIEFGIYVAAFAFTVSLAMSRAIVVYKCNTHTNVYYIQESKKEKLYYIIPVCSLWWARAWHGPYCCVYICGCRYWITQYHRFLMKERYLDSVNSIDIKI